MPFIFGNFIHADRLGGLTYYGIEGINGAESSGSGSYLPSLRKTCTDGTDITKNTGGDLGITYIKTITAAGESVTKLCHDNFSLSGSNGSNTSYSYVQQNFMDIDGNGIPDYVYRSSDLT